MDEILLTVEENMDSALEFLKKELRSLRTGRASTSLVDKLMVNYYGSPTELRQMATISTPEATQILIKPFDQSSLKEIERAIQASDLGLNPSNDGKVIRLNIPPLSIERRNQLTSQVKKMAEQARVTIRNARRDGNKEVDTAQKATTLTEDDAKKGKDKIQKLTNDYEAKVTEILEAKTKEIMES
ncbi:MAG TPA: ribosome recycling factor [Phycisphaerae bacterium]|nr:ribosome recycling factor [Phycisphaerae bacterium]HPS53079.1 ribosome recycling factor [Phycisphaerae bacterium]